MTFVDRRRIIICSHCHRKGRHAGRTWCSKCYQRWFNAGKPEGGVPPIREDRDWVTTEGLKRGNKERSQYCASVREEYFELRFSAGFQMSRKAAAERIGVHEVTARRWEREARNNGILAQDA
jgi:hypothetical protein